MDLIEHMLGISLSPEQLEMLKTGLTELLEDDAKLSEMDLADVEPIVTFSREAS
jgi:hypothetical protein